MTNRQGVVNQSQKPIEGYQGALIYRREYAYKLITTIDLRTSDERSCVMRQAKARGGLREHKKLPIDQDEVRSRKIS